MNKWVKESERLAKGDSYLDRLMEIYPPDELTRGIIASGDIKRLKEIYERKKCKELIAELIRLMKQEFRFPLDHPYIGFLSHYPDAIDKNPKIVSQICNRLLNLEFREIIEKLESPKSASRRMGPMFRNWLKNNFKFVDYNVFETCNEMVFLTGGDRTLKDYATEKLKCKFHKLTKGLDFLIKFRDRFIIGTAKFITRLGGSQTNQFNEAIRLIKETACPSNILKIAIIDGVAWIDNRMRQSLETFKKGEFALSALLLKKFLNEVF
ncbi:MAG: hypothetical protein QXS18_06090 [Thermoplasmata archaeon]